MPQTKIDEIVYLVGLLVCRWNAAERGVSIILEALFSYEKSARTLITIMKGDAITVSLNSVANDFLSGEEKEHVLHAANYLDAIREYRNFYVHTVDIHFGIGDDGTPSMFTGYRKVKRSGLDTIKLQFFKEDLDFVIHHCKEASEYAGKVEICLRKTTRPDLFELLGGKESYFADGTPVAWPPKPPIPPRLEKYLESRSGR